MMDEAVRQALEQAADPIAQPAEYQQLLLRLAGHGDPAALQAGQPDELAGLLDRAGDDLRTRPGPDDWSVLECAGHVLDAEVVCAARYRWILAHDQPPLIGYDQDLWVTRLRHQEDDPAELVALFRALRRSHVELWRRTSEAGRSRVGIHAERGPESFDLTFRMLAGHGVLHLAQAERTLETVRGLRTG